MIAAIIQTENHELYAGASSHTRNELMLSARRRQDVLVLCDVIRCASAVSGRLQHFLVSFESRLTCGSAFD
ncbi:MAG: hypothetical protein ACKERG_01010 [Candidatus Hodgkinia cicadicola]